MNFRMDLGSWLMKYLESLRDKFGGREIWVVGCGPSLDDFPEDFFNDKIVITVNASYINIPSYTYNVSQTHGNIHEFNEDISLLKKSIIGAIPRAIPHIDVERFPDFQSGWDIEDMVSAWTGPISSEVVALGVRRQLPSIAQFNTEIDIVDWKLIKEEQLPYFMKWNPLYYFVQESYDEVAKNIIEKTSKIYVLNITTLSFAIQVAAVLGAKKIFLVGCGAERIGIVHHSQSEAEYFDRVLDDRKKLGIDHTQEWWNIMWDTMFVAYKKEVGFLDIAFDKYDIEIVRYFFKSYGSYSIGENKIV